MRRQSDVGDRHAAPAVDGEVTPGSSLCSCLILTLPLTLVLTLTTPWSTDILGVWSTASKPRQITSTCSRRPACTTLLTENVTEGRARAVPHSRFADNQLMT